MVKIEFEIGSLKGLREDLCTAQTAITIAYGSRPINDYVKGKIDRIQAILDQIDLLAQMVITGTVIPNSADARMFDE